MEDKKIKDISPSGEVSGSEADVTTVDGPVKSAGKLWFENFWYHYKWHSIVAVFVIVAIVVVSLQMCTRTEYDVYIVYAGDHEIKKTVSGTNSPYAEAVKSLTRVAEDFDGDGEVNVNFLNLFVVNEEEREALLAGTTNMEINETLVKEDTETLETNIAYGDHYIFFLSERLFREYEEEFDGAIFTSLESYGNEGRTYEYLTEGKTGIYLHSLEIGDLPTLADLPEDTVVCMRALSPVSSVFGKKQNEENFERSEEVMRNILAFD